MTARKRAADLVTDIVSGRDSLVSDLSPEERVYLIRTMKDLRVGKSGLADALWAVDFERKPVNVDEFLDDPMYFGAIGAGVFPIWRQELRKILDPANEVGELILSGAIGTGKSTVATIALFYRIYYLTCMKNPQKFYGLIEGSPIVFGLFNILKYLVRDTTYKYFRTYLDLSPYFRDRCLSKDGRDKFVGFPKHISLAVGAQAIHVLGQNVFGGLLDEANFGKESSLSSDERSQIGDLYLATRRRIDSRFMQHGGACPGLLILASSPRSQGDFLTKHVDEVRSDPRTHVCEYSYWEVHAHKFDMSKTFNVYVGDRTTSSRILTPSDPVPAGTDIIQVPIEFEGRFRADLDNCIRDIAGRPTFGQSLLIPRREMITDCLAESTGRRHPFTVDTAVSSIDADTDVSLVAMIDKEHLLSLYNKSTNSWRPRLHPGMDRWIHVDLAKNRDCAGIAMGGISSMREVRRFDQDGKPYHETDYIYYIDLMLRIKAAAGSEINFARIRELIQYLRSCEFPIVGVSYDAFGSIESLQELYKAGMAVKTVSVDTKKAPYSTLRAAVVEKRLDIYSYLPFELELAALQDHSASEKRKGPVIDHPSRGSKDVADAVCGVVFNISQVKYAGQEADVDAVTPPKSETSVDDSAWVATDKADNLNDPYED